MVLTVVALAGARLITLSVQERAEQMRVQAEEDVRRYGLEIGTQLEELAQRSRASDAPPELDLLLSRLELSRVINTEYDFELSKLNAGNSPPRIFIGTRIDRLDDAASVRIPVPADFSQDLSGGNLQLSIRPRSGWYPMRELAAAIGLLALVAWLLSFATHDLVHSLHRARDAISVSRRQLQAVHRQLASEIEQRESLQKSFEHARFHDAFTGLPNRRCFMDELDRGLREVRMRRRQSLAVLLFDIDRFRLINDTLGHTAGDELLVQAARRFQKATASIECVLARWSSDQFAMLVLDLNSVEAAMDLAALLQRELQEPLDLRKHRINVAVRAGIKYLDSGLQHAEEVLREADIALTQAKQSQSAITIAYQPGMGGNSASLVSLEDDLHVALDRHELQLLFQPIINLRTQRPTGVEALLRWQHPIEGTLTPDKFLGVAEEAGLIVPITRWTIARACKLASGWRSRMPPGREFYLSVNIAGAVLSDPELGSFVAHELKDSRTPPGTLKFELTESGLISNPGAAREVLDGLHRLGIELMLDDFGTGYSSLNYLQLFPFDYVKIDRPLTHRTGSDRANSAITAAIVQMASSLGLKSVAELVETKEAAQDLERMGCDYAQGYFYSRPLEANEALRVLCSSEGALPTGKKTARVAANALVEDESPTAMLPADVVAEGIAREASKG